MTPPADADITIWNVPPTTRVDTVNVALVAPAGTVTLDASAGLSTPAPSLLDKVTTVPPVGAAPVSVTVPWSVLPPRIDGTLRVSDASVTGDPVVLIGYPTGIEGILARAGSDVAQKIADNPQSVSQIVSQLASQQLIRPTTTQGHIGDVLQDKIVYDAATTSGGSGGPLFNRSGKVIGVNFAILKNFGGSNLAVPVRYANELLK